PLDTSTSRSNRKRFAIHLDKEMIRIRDSNYFELPEPRYEFVKQMRQRSADKKGARNLSDDEKIAYRCSLRLVSQLTKCGTNLDELSHFIAITPVELLQVALRGDLRLRVAFPYFTKPPTSDEQSNLKRYLKFSAVTSKYESLCTILPVSFS